ncbi:MAG TPA: hypothetical protein VIN08_23080 [Ohtaekwangia sp.]|uniref:hypothetical protein n=1 Tax=Ohtaekwangia sp. TaxID=2066019 RepID=UPI002F9367E2
MIRSTLPVLLLLVTVYVQAQSIEDLEKRNGFKDIQLGSLADSVRGSKMKKEFKEKDTYPAKLYSVEHTDYEKIGEVKVKDIELKAYKDLIYEITVITEKDPRLMKALESLYGKADYDMKNQLYFWKSDRIMLRFKATGKHELVLEYTSPIVRNMMKEDKEKKVNDIANDF